MIFFNHVLYALGYLTSRIYGIMFCIAAVAMGLVYIASYFMTRSAR